MQASSSASSALLEVQLVGIVDLVLPADEWREILG